MRLGKDKIRKFLSERDGFPLDSLLDTFPVLRTVYRERVFNLMARFNCEYIYKNEYFFKDAFGLLS